MTGTVVTFYSYKGGVGRSSTLANVAVLLARWGYRVLAVDWDLEAPGLHYYFKDALPEEPTGGVIDLAHDFLNDTPPRSYEVRLDVAEGTLALLAAGRFAPDYAERVQSINWEDLYRRGFAAYLEQLRAEWTANYDFVLIDSRTGIADTAGICTAHLPDRLVVVFTANDQNLSDVVDIAKRADRARDAMPYDRPKHMVLPVLSRLDNRVEYERAEAWQHKCAEAVQPLFDDWLAKAVSPEAMVRHLTLPYVSYWSFGEQLPVLEEQTPSADQLSYALETVAAVIAQHFDRTDLLADNRDAYVAEARTRDEVYDLDLLVSSPRSAANLSAELIDKLIRLGVRADQSLSGIPEFLDRSPLLAKHLCLVVDGEVSRWQVNEAEYFLRQTLAPGGGQRQLFCVLTRGGNRESLPGFLRNLRPLKFGPGVARELYDLMAGGSLPMASPDRESLRDAASALRNLPAQVPYPGRLTLLRETVRGMTNALDAGDLTLLPDLSVDLELLSKTHGAGLDLPDDLAAEVRGLLDRIDRRITAFTV
ncbi:tyrosine-protein kinase family protein [Kutzneria sp. CA-103260]|uniref:tyrosine-protein kinase family protein n=1 Tax=Kutzneria sp. CA-103260 TaxID=2802641 RepID=UPI001BA9752A|nr:AAA family ATPase [Kutzneria sp. CA-103260]QUQ68609.1 CobQ/CobB/MinD/ParA nucleotide binding domain protein [Kutzneria sp. CA-103260]